MKRQKRDLSQRAYKRGYTAGVRGKSKDFCPTEHPDLRQQWMNGWRDGRSDNWDGIKGVSGIHVTSHLGTA
ncbi:MAG: ribosome modulation factor [Pseudomonadales bacterium]|uniref:Ribosome modulation factor n=1 Tax=Oleiphilus messinensis TaxID=141451 RepID=A0A1Y0IAE9_9GAMM|nr:ribosome modulation factor [Oleiphilus messinensis]ARU57497.1 ribosome modulation factor [Oleiphilus messinensis]MCG8613762.1 ribosome modulation factor [Pseudomonadales bacterium]